MNFLAHLFLSSRNEELIVGNFIADFTPNKELGHYSPLVQKGILLHRQIDSFTDGHPEVRRGTRRLQKHHRKYSPVVIDIFYDFLLTLNWSNYSEQSLSSFTEYIYTVLKKRINEMPTRLVKQLPLMIESDWLRSYSTTDGLQYTFERLKKRSKFDNKFELAPQHLLADLELYDREFNLFFPEIIRFVNAWHQH